VTEEAFGWMKTTGPLGKLLHRGLAKVAAGLHLRPRRVQPGQAGKTPGGARQSLLSRLSPG